MRSLFLTHSVDVFLSYIVTFNIKEGLGLLIVLILINPSPSIWLTLAQVTLKAE